MTARLGILTAGPFGEAVAGACRSHEPQALVVPLQDALAAPPRATAEIAFALVATWRRHPAAIETLDGRFWRIGLPWSEVTLEGPLLRAGPLVVPGSSSCYGCFRTRWLSNSPTSDRELALDSCFDRDAAIGIHGFTPSLVRIAAALALCDRRDGAVAAGRVRWFDVRTGSLFEERVVRIHGCRRCGGDRRPGERYWRQLRDVVLAPGRG